MTLTVSSFLLLFIVSQRLVRPVSPPVTFLILDWLDDWLDVVGHFQDGAVGGATLGFDVFRRSGHNFRTGSHEQLQTGRPVLGVGAVADFEWSPRRPAFASCWRTIPPRREERPRRVKYWASLLLGSISSSRPARLLVPGFKIIQNFYFFL
jgi:hypothetical protein